MDKFEKSRIRQYEVFIRDMANQVVQRVDFDKLDKTGQSFLSKMDKIFKFGDERGWKFLTSSLDVLGDSQFAITNFSYNKIENKRQFNTGERYLRIYGVLGAIYIQQQSIIKLFDLSRLDGINTLKDEFSKMKITFLRHCISAHPINFDDTGNKVSYKIDRNSIKDDGNLSIRNENNNSEIYNIFTCLDEYTRKTESTLEDIARKIILNLHKSSTEKIKELEDKLNKI